MRRLAVAAALLVGVLVIGTAGYALIEHWGWFDAFYMTAITVATVGFREVHPLSNAGRVFTILLIVTGVGAIGFSFGTLVDFLVEGRLKGILEGRRMTRKIEDLTKHHVIAGFGRVGKVIAAELAKEGTDFVLVDSSEPALEEAKSAGWLFVLGDATEEETLRSAGIERAESLITALDQDADNLFVTVTAKTMNPALFIVSRSSSEASAAKLVRAGVNRVIVPTVIGGRRMASLVLHPFVSDYLDLVTHDADIEYRLQEMDLPPSSPIAGKSIRQSAVRDRFGAFILAVRGADGVIDTNPSFDRVLMAGDRLVVLGTNAQLAALAQAM